MLAKILISYGLVTQAYAFYCKILQSTGMYVFLNIDYEKDVTKRFFVFDIRPDRHKWIFVIKIVNIFN